MSLDRSSKTVVICLAAVAAILSMLTPGTATAAEQRYQHAVANYTFQYDGFAGGYVSCPPGMKAIASGVASSTGWMQAGLTTFDSNGAYGAASFGSGSLQVSAQCVEATKLTGSTLATNTIRDRRSGWRQYHRKVTCPAGTVPYGGGGFVSTSAGPSQSGASPRPFASFPDGTGWQYAAAGYLNGAALVISTHCLPRVRLGKIVHARASDTYPGVTKTGTLLATARCPEGHFAFAGGALFQGEDSRLAPMGHLKISQMAADDRGWTALGTVYGPSSMTSWVMCTDRLG